MASDDDYYNIPETPFPADTEVKGNSTLPRLKSSSSALAAATNTSLQSSPAKSNSSGNSTSLYSSTTAAAGKRLGNESSAAGPPLTTISHSSEYYALKQQLENSEFRVQALIDSNGDMRHEISRLSVMVNKLVNENHVLRSSSHEAMDFMPVENEYATPQTLATQFVKPPPPVRSTTTSVTTTTATNLFEPQRPRPPPSSVGTGGSGPTSLPVYVAATASAAASAAVNNARHSTPYQGGGSYLIEDEASHGSASLPVSGHDFFNSTASSTSGSATCLPSQEEVVRRTEAITRCIQELVIISSPMTPYHLLILIFIFLLIFSWSPPKMKNSTLSYPA